MQNILKNKFLPILIILLLCSFVLCSNVFASDRTFNVNDNDITISFDDSISSFKYIILYYYQVSGNYPTYYHYFRLFVSNEPITLTLNPQGSISDYYSLSGNFYYKDVSYQVRYYDTVNIEYIQPKLESMTFSDLSSSSSLGSDSLKPSNIYLSSHNIYDTNGDLVFQVAPQIPEITAALVEQAQKVGITPLLEIKTILPIIIAVIVGLIACWKGLQFLSNSLKRV